MVDIRDPHRQILVSAGLRCRCRMDSATMCMCRFVVALSILLSAMSGAVADPISSIATSDVDGKPMPLLPDSFQEVPAVPQSAAAAPVPAVTASPDAAYYSGAQPPRLLNKTEQQQTASKLRALAERNAKRSGRGSSNFATRLRRLGNSHGADALNQIELD